MKEVILPSGAKLEIMHVPFSEAKAFYQAVLEEAKGVHLNLKEELDNAIKDIVCICLASQKVDALLSKVMERSLYNGLKIAKDTFEKDENRADYSAVCLEVAVETIAPFLKGLFAGLGRLSAMAPGYQK